MFAKTSNWTITKDVYSQEKAEENEFCGILNIQHRTHHFIGEIFFFFSVDGVIYFSV